MFTINHRETSYGGHDAMFFVTDQIGGIIGSAFASIAKEAVILDSIQTNPPYRGRGIGSALLVAVQAWGREQGATRLIGNFKPDISARPTDVERFYCRRGISITPDGTLESNLLEALDSSSV